MDAGKRVAALVLAAGASSRMRSPKPLVRWRGASLLRQVAKTAIFSPCSDVFVVLGDRAERLRPEVGDLELRIVEAPDWRDGLSASIRAGVEAVATHAPHCDALLVLLCDQPQVSAELISQLIEARADTGLDMAACAYADTIGPPALFGRQLFAELARLEGDRGAKTMLTRDPSAVAQVAFPAGADDLDTPADLSLLQQAEAEEQRPVAPDGLAIRRRRHERGWGPGDLIRAIGDASDRATGVRETISPNLLAAIEEHCEIVPYDTLCLVAGGLDCDPIDVLRGEDTGAKLLASPRGHE